MKAFLRRVIAALPRVRKTTAAVWGTLTPPAVVGVLALAGVHIDTAAAVLILGVGAAVLAPAAVYRAGANAPAPDATTAPAPGEVAP
ncbi:hypothetical protein AB0J55_17840 [Amycolatopsis sp. NPDC049688]|uniref:hypothetical protein n=1 Tax=Amycolatopsis sp. NPDC049688 TaxID=3154733 RepID=UPI0034394202